MVKKSLIWLYSVTTWLLWAAIIVVALTVLGLRYFVLPNIQGYKDEIAQRISQQTGQKITIGDIRASWDGMSPHLDLLRVDLYDAQNRPALTLDHVETSLSWLSLPLGEVRLARLVIHEPRLTVRREKDGTLYVAGIAMGGPSRPGFSNWLLRQSSIDVHNASVVWQDDLRGAPPLSLDRLRLSLTSPAWAGLLGRHRFGLEATPSAGSSLPITLRGDLYGKDVSQPEQWRGTLYARLEGTDLAAWRTWLPVPAQLQSGYGATQLWLDIAHGKPQKVVADAVFSQVSARFEAAEPAAFSKLAGRITWQRQQDGHAIHAEKLQLAAAGLQMRDGELRLRQRIVDGKTRMEGSLALDAISLQHLAAFTRHFPIGDKIRQILADTAPQGELRDLRLDWQNTPDSLDTYRARGRFLGLAMSPYRHIPGFRGLSGEFDASQDKGWVSLAAANATLDLKDVLRWPLPVSKLGGRIDWTLARNALEIRLSQLAVENPHLAGVINGRYQRAGQGRGTLDLTAKLSRADGRHARYYFPTVLGPGTLHWLDNGILAGQARDVNVIVKGNLDHFPWHNSRQGLFQVTAKISGGRLHYAEGWPEIDAIALDMLFRGNRMELEASQGRIFNTRLSATKVVIPELHSEHPVLEITGQAEGPAHDAMRYLNTSPLLELTGHATEHMQASGNGKLALGLRIPLKRDGGSTRVKGRYTLSHGRLVVGDTLPPLDNVNGQLQFTEASLRADGVQASAYGSPLRFSLDRQPSGLFRISAQGRMNDSGLRQLIRHPVAAKLYGSTPWSAQVDLKDGTRTVSIQSSLDGLAVALPAPFGKGPDERRELVIQARPEGPRELIRASYGKIASALLLRDGDRIERGDVRFGAPAVLPTRPGIAVSGQLDYVDWEQWRALAGGASGGAAPAIGSVDLAIGALDIFGRRIQQLELDARPISDGWVMSLASREITGDVTWVEGGNGKVVARLKKLLPPPPAPPGLSAPDEDSAGAQNYPALDIIAEEFEYKQKKLGRLELIADQEGRNWNIQKLVLDNPDSLLAMTGTWQSWRRNPTTRMLLSWKINHLGDMLTRLGYSGVISGGQASLGGQLQWPGSPHELDVRRLSGKLQVEASDGQFLKAQPGVGRLFSVLSLQNLPRRLLLDFSDVFSSGFAFSNISGNADIRQGVMRSDDFTMVGPAALVQIRGETDLNRETQNLHIKVTPSVSDSLSLAAFAGGPAVGIAAFIAQKILQDPLSKLVSYSYDITGTWDDPREVKSSAPKSEETPAPTPFPTHK